jgi:hypothetical protein
LLTLILIQSTEFTFLCLDNYLNLPENLLEMYLKLLMSNYWGGGGVSPHIRPGRYGPGRATDGGIAGKF